MGRLLNGSMMGLVSTFSMRAYATCCVTQVYCSQGPCPHGRPLLTHASAGDRHSKVGLAQSLVCSLGPGVHKVLFMPHHRATGHLSPTIEPPRRQPTNWRTIIKVVLTLLQKFYGPQQISQPGDPAKRLRTQRECDFEG